MSLLFGLFWILLLLALVGSSKILRENERAVVFRKGQFLAVRGPGFVFVVPLLERIQVIDLNEWIPEWRSLPKSVINERVEYMVLSQPRE
jgi:regulator of protease activity HflC (stomatin/prohibitin superfamily)